MKRTLLFLAIISITYSMDAQWKYQEINNPFDGVTRKVYIKGKRINPSNPSFFNPTLVLEKNFKSNFIMVRINDAEKFSSCQEFQCAQINVKVDGKDDLMNFLATRAYGNSDYDWAFYKLDKDLRNQFNQLLDLMKKNNKLYVRLFSKHGLFEKVYGDYEFSLRGSAKAIQYLLGKN